MTGAIICYEIPPGDVPAKFAHKRRVSGRAQNDTVTQRTRCSMNPRPSIPDSGRAAAECHITVSQQVSKAEV